MKILTTDYMESFRCLAQDCEDSCCKRWSVRLDKDHYTRIHQLGTQHPELLATITRVVHVVPPPTDKHHYATIEMDEAGYCPFLNHDRLCQLQRLGGVEVLGNTCANYPRVYYKIDDTLEVAGALSCPEVTRLCFRSEQPSALKTVDTAIIPRGDYTLTHHIDTQKSTYYERRFPDIRKVFLQLAQHPDYTTKQKLYLLAYLSHRISVNYNSECDDSIESSLEHELKRFSGDELKQSLFKHLEKFQDTKMDGLITVQSIFSIRIQHYQQDPLTPYINDIIQSYIEGTPFDMEISALFSIYSERKKGIVQSVNAQIENYLSRHLQNCLLREWYIRFPDPFNYIQMLVLRQAMLRFMLYGHPAFYKWCHSEYNHQDLTLHSVIEELSVEIFYLFSRSIEHDMDFLQNIYSAMISEDMMNLDTTLALLKGL